MLLFLTLSLQTLISASPANSDALTAPVLGRSSQANTSALGYDPVLQVYGANTPALGLPGAGAARPGTLSMGWLGAADALLAIDVTTDIAVELSPTSASTTVLYNLPASTITAATWDATDGVTWVADATSDSIWRVDGAGAIVSLGPTGIDALNGLEFVSNPRRLLGLDGFSRLYQIDMQTGAATLIGNTGWQHLSGLAWDPVQQRLLASYAWSNQLGWLVEIDPATGQGTALVQTARLTDLAFDHNGDLFGVDNGSSSSNPSTLYRLLPQSGAALTIGTSPSTNLLSLSFRTPETPSVVCSSSPNSTGQAARLDWSGEPSLASWSLQLHASDGPPGQVALFLFSDQVGNHPFGNGTRCVSGSWARSAVFHIDQNGNLRRPIDPNMTALANPAPWSVRYVQLAFRDPSAGGAAFDISEALRIPILP